MKLKVENASIQLLNTLYEIEKQCFKEEAFSKQQIDYLLSDYNSISLVAKVNKESVGFIIGRIDLINSQPVGHIMTIDVVPFHRRKGIAQRLMFEIETIFELKEVKECQLEVREDNSAALSLYLKLGYCKMGVLENYYGEAHGFFLKKNLVK